MVGPKSVPHFVIFRRDGRILQDFYILLRTARVVGKMKKTLKFYFRILYSKYE